MKRLFLLTVTIFAVLACKAETTIWEEGQVSSVTDNNVRLKGHKITLPEGTTAITSNLAPVNVYLDSYHHHHDYCGSKHTSESCKIFPTNNSTLNLVTNLSDSSILIHVTRELEFCSTPDSNLTVAQVGPGTITFKVRG